MITSIKLVPFLKSSLHSLFFFSKFSSDPKQEKKKEKKSYIVILLYKNVDTSNAGGRGRRRMSASDNNREKNTNSLAGLTLDAVVNRPNTGLTAAQMNKTLIDIIKDEEKGSLFGQKDKKSWKAFRDRLRLKRAGAAWTSSIHIPTSDIPIQKSTNNSTSPNSKFLASRRNSVRFTTPSHDESTHAGQLSDGSKHHMNHRSSADESDGGFEPDARAVGDLTPQQSSKLARHDSARISAEAEGYGEDAPRRKPRVVFADERQLSAREAVADQEAADAEAAAKAQREEEEDEEGDDEDGEDEEDGDGEGGGGDGGPMRMSLMDLLEETDRQMGVVGSRYAIDDDEGACEEEDEDDGGGGNEHTCCVCMVKHKGAAFIPCGHTFCRLCSREQGVQRGNCPLCNGFILEMLDIF